MTVVIKLQAFPPSFISCMASEDNAENDYQTCYCSKCKGHKKKISSRSRRRHEMNDWNHQHSSEVDPDVNFVFVLVEKIFTLFCYEDISI